MLHHTKEQVFRASACKQTAVGVYRTLTVQAGICVEVAAGAACTKPQYIQLVGTLHFLKLSNFKYNDA